MLLRPILFGGVWNASLLSKAKNEDIKCRFCDALDNVGHLSRECSFLLFLELRNSPEFAYLMRRDRTKVAASDLACNNLEKALGPYPVCTDSSWNPKWDLDDVHEMAEAVPDQPNIWSDGSMEPIPHLDVEVAGAECLSIFQLVHLVTLCGHMRRT